MPRLPDEAEEGFVSCERVPIYVANELQTNYEKDEFLSLPSGSGLII